MEDELKDPFVEDADDEVTVAEPLEEDIDDEDAADDAMWDDDTEE